MFEKLLLSFNNIIHLLKEYIFVLVKNILMVDSFHTKENIVYISLKFQEIISEIK